MVGILYGYSTMVGKLVPDTLQNMCDIRDIVRDFLKVLFNFFF